MGEVPNSILPLEESLHSTFVAGEELLDVCRAAADADELRVLQATERAHRQRGAEDEERGDAAGELADGWF